MFFGCGFEDVFVKCASEMSKNDEKRCDAAEALRSIVLVEAVLRAELVRSDWGRGA